MASAQAGALLTRLQLNSEQLHTSRNVTILEQLAADLAEVCPVLMPSGARAATIEVVQALVTLRVYLHGPGSLDRWEALDAQFTPLIEERLPAGQPWDVIVQAFRRDRPEPLDVFGSLLWIERGASVASRDGRGAARE